MTQPPPTRCITLKDVAATRVELLQKVFIMALKQRAAFSTSFFPPKNHKMGREKCRFCGTMALLLITITVTNTELTGDYPYLSRVGFSVYRQSECNG